jgi:hypothetical protein
MLSEDLFHDLILCRSGEVYIMDRTGDTGEP